MGYHGYRLRKHQLHHVCPRDRPVTAHDKEPTSIYRCDPQNGILSTLFPCVMRVGKLGEIPQSVLIVLIGLSRKPNVLSINCLLSHYGSDMAKATDLARMNDKFSFIKRANFKSCMSHSKHSDIHSKI